MYFGKLKALKHFRDMVVKWQSTNYPPRSISIPCLIFILAVTTVGSLVPFSMEATWGIVLEELWAALSFSLCRPFMLTIIERLITFVPIGLLVYWVVANRDYRKPIITSMVIISVYAFILELGQSIVMSRHARFTDMLIGIVSGFIGIRVSLYLRYYRLSLREFYLKYDRLIAVCLLVSGNVVISVPAVVAHTGLDLKNWDLDYPLIIANEATGDRPWLGKIRKLIIYSKALTPKSIVNDFQQSSEGISETFPYDACMIVKYLFDPFRDRRIPQLVSDGPALEMVLPPAGADTWIAADGVLEIRSPLIVKSLDSARVICNKIMASNAFTVELEIATADLTQFGPARIVSISSDTDHRNLTIGQRKDQITLRFLNRRMGPNGSRISCHTRHGVLTTGWQHVVAGYENGVAHIYVDGREVRHPLYLYRMSVMVLRNGHPISGVLAAAVLYIPMGVFAVISFLGLRLRRALILGMCCALVLPLMLSISVTVVYGREQDYIFWCSALIMVLLGCYLGPQCYFRKL